MEENQDKIPMEIATQLEVVQRNQQNSTPTAVDDTIYVMAKPQTKKNNPPEDPDEGSSSRSSYR